MPRRKQTKTAAVIAVKQKHPDWKPREISANLRTQGIDITNARVSNVLFNNRERWSGSNGNGHAGNGEIQPTEAIGIPQQKQRPPIGDAVEQLVLAKQFVDAVGGIDQAIAAVNGLIRVCGLEQSNYAALGRV